VFLGSDETCFEAAESVCFVRHARARARAHTHTNSQKELGVWD